MLTGTAEAPQSIVCRGEWQALRRAHLRRVAALADAFVLRRSRGEKHPVHDFLFTYYSFSPAKLKQWVPALGAVIEVTDDDLSALPWLAQPPFILHRGCARLAAHQLTSVIRQRAAQIAALCAAILERPPRFRCHGLHEWAMVYQQSAAEVRHSGWDLRMPAEDLARFLESQTLCCSHYDAFRFFTQPARPLNAWQPTLESRAELEQAGCLHANMDLYKWSAKLWPWVGSDLVGRCFELALQGRELDMRASPYDLRAMGYEPVRIETPEGRAEYEEAQRSLTAAATPLREELLRRAQFIADFATTHEPGGDLACVANRDFSAPTSVDAHPGLPAGPRTA